MHRLNGRFHIAVARYEDPDEILPLLFKGPKGLESVDSGHQHIQEDQMKGLGQAQVQRLLAAIGLDDLVSFVVQDMPAQINNDLFVIDNEDCLLGHKEYLGV